VLGETVSQFLDTKHKADRGDLEALCAFVNTALAKIWRKDAIYSKLKVSTPGPGYCHFPIALQQEFFNQLTTEEVRTRFVRGHPVRYWFKPSGKRNEALDRRVYALAALHSRPVLWGVLRRGAPTEPPPPTVTRRYAHLPRHRCPRLKLIDHWPPKTRRAMILKCGNMLVVYAIVEELDREGPADDESLPSRRVHMFERIRTYSEIPLRPVRWNHDVRL
jgi:hypothetical protein